MLIRLGEHPQHAKEIALAILLHTDSYLPEGELKRKPLQTIVKLADEADEEPGGKHHYRQIDDELALKKFNNSIAWSSNNYNAMPSIKLAKARRYA